MCRDVQLESGSAGCLLVANAVCGSRELLRGRERGSKRERERREGERGRGVCTTFRASWSYQGNPKSLVHNNGQLVLVTCQICQPRRPIQRLITCVLKQQHRCFSLERRLQSVKSSHLHSLHDVINKCAYQHVRSIDRGEPHLFVAAGGHTCTCPRSF